MQSSAVVLMEKEKETGFLTTMRGSFFVEQGISLMDKIYLIKEEKEEIHMFVTVPREVEDWEYTGIFDEYNTEIFSKEDLSVLEIKEIEEEYDPIWEIIFLYDERHSVTEERIKGILSIHQEELDRVFKAIEGKKEKYEEN